jgi:Arc/MetJ family transcription regulator
MTTTEQPTKRKTTVEIDVDLLAQAQEALGTTGVKETIDKALLEAWRWVMLRQFMERIRTQEGVDIGPEVLEETRAGWAKWAD